MKKKLKRYQVGIDSETYAISLVEYPAIESDFIALSEQKPMQMSDEYRHIIYGPCLIPDKPIYRNDDGFEYYVEFTKESIEKMSQDFFLNMRQKDITLDHETDANEVYVVESWIVEDEYKDKSVALGLDVPKGTWMTGVKINNVEVWDRIMGGELNGFSVEALVSLEELNLKKQDTMEENMFWSRMKRLFEEFFGKEAETVTETQETVEASDTVEDTNTVTETQDAEEDNVEPTQEDKEETTESQEVVETDDTVSAAEEATVHMAELIENLKAEIEALRKSNSTLEAKIEGIEKRPSAQPVNVNSRQSSGNSYSQWREQMGRYLNS